MTSDEFYKEVKTSSLCPNDFNELYNKLDNSIPNYII